MISACCLQGNYFFIIFPGKLNILGIRFSSYGVTNFPSSSSSAGETTGAGAGAGALAA